MTSEFVQATAFCGRLGEPSYFCLVWSILSEENQYIAQHPTPPPTPLPNPKKICSAEFTGPIFEEW